LLSTQYIPGILTQTVEETLLLTSIISTITRKSLSEIAQLTSQISLKTLKQILEIFTLTSSLSNLFGTLRVETVSVVDSLRRDVSKFLINPLSFSGSIINGVYYHLIESLTISESSLKSFSKYLLGAISFFSSLETITEYLRNFTESLTLNDSISIVLQGVFTKLLVEVLILSGSVSLIHSIFKTLSESISFSGSCSTTALLIRFIITTYTRLTIGGKITAKIMETVEDGMLAVGAVVNSKRHSVKSKEKTEQTSG